MTKRRRRRRRTLLGEIERELVSPNGRETTIMTREGTKVEVTDRKRVTFLGDGDDPSEE